MLLRHLRTVQFDLMSWSPHPDVRALRALACEVHTFCPQINNVVFWLGSMRVTWVWVEDNDNDGDGDKDKDKDKRFGQWHSQIDLQQYPPFDLMWSLV